MFGSVVWLVGWLTVGECFVGTRSPFLANKIMATGTTGSVSWVVITIEDCYSRMAAAQLDALKTAAVSDTQPDVFDTVMPDVVGRIRQFIVSNPRNRLSETENSVPPECKWMAVWLTLQEMMGRLSIALTLTDDQKKQIDQANTDLDKLRKMEMPWLLVSVPVDPESNPAMMAGPYVEVVSSTVRKMTRSTLQGL